MTLYYLLQSERIEIPMIQRDYAQGREDKIFLRERLLGKLINALQFNKVLSLDFVYGTNEHNAIWPLDGQQRLTTLWLLHWYLAVRTNNLSKAKVWLNNFTYETRVSSRIFCTSLCSIDSNAFNKSGMRIVDFIKDQTWYYSKYAFDPTIQGMLCTLGGTNFTNSKHIDITDGIEEYLCDDKDCKLYWERLISDNCPIQFLFKDMKDENLPLSDDLYIKMNARGKQLSDFENFKADLNGFATNPDCPDIKLLDIETQSLIDNEWTDLFWKEAVKKQVFKVDDIFFEFLRRYLLNRLIADSSRTVEETLKVGLFQELYHEDKEYTGLKGYEVVLTQSTIEKLKLLFSRWNGVEIRPHWKNAEAFAFIPEYIIKGTDDKSQPTIFDVSPISIKERAIFHAVTCFFEENENYDEERFINWMRFAWNIVENSSLDSENAMIGAIRFFEELRPYSGQIISFLANGARIRSNYATQQLEEERFKAKLMLGKKGNEWKTLIQAAESSSFLKGNIACLLRYDKKTLVDDIECFRNKYSKAQKYFGDKQIRSEYATSLIKALIKICHSWDQLKQQRIFDIEADAWKQNVLNGSDPGYYGEIHKLLTTDDLESLQFVEFDNCDVDWFESANKIKELFAQTSFLEHSTFYGQIIKSGSEWRLKWAPPVMAFYPYRRSYAFILDWVELDANYSFRRNELLHHRNIEVDAENYDNNGIYWNWSITFKYNGYSFKWDYKNDIYLLNRQNNPKRRDAHHKNSANDEYFCIHMNKFVDITQQGLLIRLTNLIKESGI